jgi:signal transduction histidine kinase
VAGARDTLRRMSWAPPVWLRHPSERTVDVALTGLVALPVLAGSFGSSQARRDPLVGLLGLLAVLPLMIRRRRPVLALALVLSAGVLVPGQGSFLLAALVCLYTIAATCSSRVTLIASVAAVAAVILHRLVWEQLGSAGDFPPPVIACATAVALGLYSAARRASMAALQDRAERLERERELLAQHAVAEERVRLANELHDVVAHNVSLIVVQAQALGATARDPAVTAATDGIAALGRQAMADMHRTLKLLRTGGDDAAIRAPQPSLENLDGLLEQSRAAGLDIELTIEGHPRALAQGVDLSAFRIVQEALTNVIKHARRAHTRVLVSYRPESLHLIITNDPSPIGDAAPQINGAGHGLIGMRERVTLFGGTLLAQPTADNGFQVSATLPYGNASGV